jgi:integrase
MFRLAVRHGATPANPVREAAPISAPRKSRVRSLTQDEVDELRRLLRAHSRAVELDLPDIVDFMLGTGVRIGEALAVRHGTNADGEPLLDLDHATVEINATIVRVKGEGKEHRPRAPHGIVFGSPLGHLRDPSNIAGDLRRVLDGIGCKVCGERGWFTDAYGKPTRCDAGQFSWVTSHIFRKTVATRLDEAGLSARQIADQLGHAHPSLTQDVYMGRKVVTADAARLLDRQLS